MIFPRLCPTVPFSFFTIKNGRLGGQGGPVFWLCFGNLIQHACEPLRSLTVHKKISETSIIGGLLKLEHSAGSRQGDYRGGPVVTGKELVILRALLAWTIDPTRGISMERTPCKPQSLLIGEGSRYVDDSNSIEHGS